MNDELKNKVLRVTNRSAMRVIYSIKSLNINRDFAPGQTLNISYEELENLSFQPGGKTLMAEYLLITDPDDKDYKNPNVEPEYYYTDEQVKELLLSGSLDEFLDALDFAPDGVLELIKKYAYELPVNDIAKREALKEKLHFDVTAMIENSGADVDTPVEPKEAPKRRAAVKTEEAPRTRRTKKSEEPAE